MPVGRCIGRHSVFHHELEFHGEVTVARGFLVLYRQIGAEGDLHAGMVRIGEIRLMEVVEIDPPSAEKTYPRLWKHKVIFELSSPGRMLA